MPADPDVSVELSRRLVALAVDQAVGDLLDDLAAQGEAIASQVIASGGSDERSRLTEAQLNGLSDIALHARAVSEIDRFIQRQAERRRPWEAAGRPLRDAVAGLASQASQLGEELTTSLQGRHPEGGPRRGEAP